VIPLSTYPRISTNDNVGAINNARPIRDAGGNFLITGQVADTVAAHTAGDIPVSALGRGAKLFTGVMDNTDVFFKAMQAALGGATN
jgi:alkaline phosphatase